MTVTLRIYHGKGRRPREFILSPQEEAALPFLTVWSHDRVRASISLSNDEHGGRFRLMKGTLPDVKAYVDAGSGCCSEDFEWYDSDKNEYVLDFKLFRGGLGVNDLFLVREQLGTEKGDLYEKIAKVYVEDKKKRKLYNAMELDLVNNKFPHFVIDDHRGQMKKDRFSIEFKAGYASFEDDDIMLRHLQRFIKEITPLLTCIVHAPILRYKNVSCRRPISMVSRICNATRKAVMRSSKSLRDMCEHNVCICDSRKEVTTITRVHSAIRTVLDRYVLRRLINIRRAFKKSNVSLMEEIKKKEKDILGVRGKNNKRKVEANLCNVRAEKGNEYNENLKNIESADTNIKLVQRFLRMPIFSELQDEVMVYDLSPTDFMVNDAYRALYAKMVEFLGHRLWWRGDDEVPTGRWKIPQLRFDETFGEQLWQENYSRVYENWCYAQMFLALEGLGYKYCESDGLKQSTCGSCVFEKGGIRVGIVHDVIPEVPWKTRRTPGFSTQKDMTPDFALIVSVNGEDGVSWYVMDAKSDASGIQPHMVRAILKYVDSGFVYQKKHKTGVFIIRSGDEDCTNKAIDVPPSTIPQFPVKNVSPQELEYWFSRNYTWIQNSHIENNGRQVEDYPFIGYLRVNAFSSNRGDVVQEFLNVLINTAVQDIKGRLQ